MTFSERPQDSQTQRALDGKGEQVDYVCGGCGAKLTIGKRDMVRCHTCGHRVMYKERTKRYVVCVDSAVRPILACPSIATGAFGCEEHS